MWEQIDSNTWTKDGSDYIYHIAEDAIGLRDGNTGFDFKLASNFLEAAREHVLKIKLSQHLELSQQILKLTQGLVDLNANKKDVYKLYLEGTVSEQLVYKVLTDEQ